MEILNSLDRIEALCAQGTCLAIGMFDGVHRGHQALIAQATAQARARGLKSLAFTFRQHPLSILAPPYAPPLLSSADEKAALLADQGLDYCAMLEFTAAFAAMQAGEFLQQVVARRCQARYLVCGGDFHFGARGLGDVELLARSQSALGYELEVRPDLNDDGRAIRSTRIRQSLLGGRVAEAARLLGRPYALSGPVARGDQRGRTIGYPTANLEASPGKLVPQHGVYAVRARAAGAEHNAMLNIGVRPTFGVNQRSIEAYLFDFSGDLYGQIVTLSFVTKVRDEMKFTSIDELAEQLRKDETTCRGVLTPPVSFR